jgi:quinol monooxygenase YgiN
MYIRITTATFDPAKEEEILRIIDEHMLPAMRRLPGYQSYTGGLDRKAGRAVAVSVWDNMDHAQEFRNALGSLVQHFEAASVRFDPPQIFEIVRQF